MGVGKPISIGNALKSSPKPPGMGRVSSGKVFIPDRIASLITLPNSVENCSGEEYAGLISGTPDIISGCPIP